MGRKVTLAKISRPRLFGVVARECLFALLDENRGRPLIWISGPPGAGKTTLVASYYEARPCPVIWYQVDPGDADPAALFVYLSQAASTVLECDEPTLPRFVAEHFSDLTGFARLFFRAFFAQLPAELILVFDNYQDVAESAPLHDIVSQAVAEVPPGSSIVAVSRMEVPRQFVKRIADNAVAHIGADSLQLNLDEVRAVCRERQVTDEWLLKALHQQSAGWAAGITLMLERLGHADGASHELPTDTREAVFDYFASLIFDREPEATRHILLSIALLPRVTPALAVELSACSQAPELLEDLYRRRMFTDRRPGPEAVYQFHALFLGFLRKRCQEALAPPEFTAQLARSAAVLEKAGDIDGAMNLWIESRNWASAARVIRREASGLLNSGRRQTLQQWIESIPEPVRATEPWLVYWQARAQLRNRAEDGMAGLQHAHALFVANDDARGRLECLCALLTGASAWLRALDQIDPWLDELLDEMSRLSEIPSPDDELRVWGALCMTLFHARPWHPLTIPAYQRVQQLLPHCRDPGVALEAAVSAFVVSGFCGDFDCGDRVARQTEAFARTDPANPTDAAWWYARLGYLRFIEARYEASIENLEHAHRIAQSNGLQSLMPAITLWRYTVEYRMLGWSAANPTLAAVEAMPQPDALTARALVSLYQARRACCRGHYEEAVRLAALAHETAMRTRSCLEEMVLCLCTADIFLEADQPEEAGPLLGHARGLIERAPSYDCWMAAQVFLEAQLAVKEGRAQESIEWLRQSLALARKGNRRYFLRIAVDRALLPLFERALSEGIEVDLVRELIRTFRLVPTKQTPDNWPWPVKIVTLGRFEVLVNDEPIRFARKTPRKVLLLLKAIVAQGGRDVPEQALCDALWGDEEGDAANHALDITIARLRKLLGTPEAIVQQGGKISLDSERCRVDAWVFDANLGKAADRPLLDLYGGAFLPEDTAEPWSVAMRERLRGKFIHALSSCGDVLESSGDLEGAVQCYLRGIDADPVVEAFHQGLMRCYERMGRRTEAISVFRRMKQTLSVLLGVPPSEASQRLFQVLLQDQLEDGAETPDGPASAEPRRAAGERVVSMEKRRRGSRH
jgi:LuxR family transcriptional regulator, maltose regulon positive regulatory protein